MNRLTKLIGGLVTVLALTAFAAVPALADDSDDNHDVTIEANDVALVNVEGSTITFDTSDFDTAGENFSNTDSTSDTMLDWTTNAEAKITVCNDQNATTFDGSNGFGSGPNSGSWLTVEYTGSNDGIGGSTSQPEVLLFNATSSNDPSYGESATDCNGSADLITYILKGSETDREVTYRAEYDIRDGEFSDSSTIKYTIEHM